MVGVGWVLGRIKNLSLSVFSWEGGGGWRHQTERLEHLSVRGGWRGLSPNRKESDKLLMKFKLWTPSVVSLGG